MLAAAARAAEAPLPSRYRHHGDGVLNLNTTKGKATFRGRYRNADGSYDEAALRKIHAVFQAQYGQPISTIATRLIEYLDLLQDRFNPKARITIYSGYRSPAYNTGLRNKGKLAAKASLHQYGMAADIGIAGVHPAKIWKAVQEIGFGGAGYYGGKLVHVDVGPARSWDAATSGVGTGLSDENKLICLVADRDIYLSGEPIALRFTRMTLFPIGVQPTFLLEREKKPGEWKRVDDFRPAFTVAAEGTCPQFKDIGEMLNIRWTLPKRLKPGTYRVRASFCDRRSEAMPESIVTDPFEVRRETR